MMTQGGSVPTPDEMAGQAATAGVAHDAGLWWKDPRVQAGVVLAAVFAIAFGAVDYWLSAKGQHVQQQDYVTGFEQMCIPEAAHKFAAVGLDSAQAKVRATGYCHCVATTVADKLTPEMLAEAKSTKKMPDNLRSDIGKAVFACQ